MHAGPPEVGFFRYSSGLVAEHALDVVADEGRREVAACLEAVDHGRRAVQQKVEAGARGVLGLLGLLSAR